MPEDIQTLLRDMVGRLARIEASLEGRSCGDHKRWLADHERRLRAVEIKIYTIWMGMIIAGGVLGYWLEGVLK